MRKLTTLLVIWLTIAVAVGGIGCSGKSSIPEPTIPPNFTTYTDDTGTFSISYPADWETPLSMLPELEQKAKDYLTSLSSHAPVDSLQVVFWAHDPTNYGGFPSMDISVEPIPANLQTLDSIVDAAIRTEKSLYPNFHELSQSKNNCGRRRSNN